MKTVGISEARTHFSELLRNVENGESIIVARHGVAVARIDPIRNDFRDAASAIDELHRFWEEHNFRLGSDVTIRELIEEGRH